MPWKKNFDIDEATQKAIEVFWAKGFEATSISDLVDAMEINKGSLYNAFGSKNDLFLTALRRYDCDNRKKTLAHLEAMNAPVEAIRQLFDGLVDKSLADPARKGCLLVNTALELPNHSEDVQGMVTSALDEFEQFFKNSIRLGQRCGDIPRTVDPETAAKALLTLVVGLRVLSRGVFDGVSLGAIRDQAMQIVQPKVH